MLSELSKTCVCCIREGKPEVVPSIFLRRTYGRNSPIEAYDASLRYECNHSSSGRGVCGLPTEAEAVASLRRMYPQISE